MADTTRYPLAWPPHRPRTKYRKSGKFSYTSERGYKEDITVPRAMDRLEEEVKRLGGTNTLLSTNVDTRLDGRPRGGMAEPADPGVCLYFTLKGKPISLPCDAYTRVAQNIAALAAHLEATRAIERHGVATGSETLQAFSALPPPSQAVIALGSGKPWREVMGFSTHFPGGGLTKADTTDLVSKRYRDLARKACEAELKDLNRARDAATAELEL